MNAKTIVLVVGLIATAIAIADVATGNTNHPILPDFIGGHLDQQEDLLLGAVGGATIWFALTQL